MDFETGLKNALLNATDGTKVEFGTEQRIKADYRTREAPEPKVLQIYADNRKKLAEEKKKQDELQVSPAQPTVKTSTRGRKAKATGTTKA